MGLEIGQIRKRETKKSTIMGFYHAKNHNNFLCWTTIEVIRQIHNQVITIAN